MNTNLLFWVIVSFFFIATSCGNPSNESSTTENNPTQSTVKMDASTLAIHIPKDQWMKLQRKRETALKLGVLVNTSADYATGSLAYGGQTHTIEIRLKGKDAKSLENKHLSYKIRVKGGSFKGMRSFSIHLPEEKGDSKEWVMHQILEQEDLLTPRYGFINVIINSNEAVLYAWEEHYEKQLVESKKRREGPIVRFNDESKLDAQVRGLKNVNLFPFLDYASVAPYREGKTKSDSILKMHFEQANILMNQFRKGNLSESVNLDKLAKICALSRKFAGSEYLNWSNVCFYYDPILSRLEPIGNDFFNPIEPDISTSQLIDLCIKNKEFQKHWSNAIEKYNSAEFIEECKSNLQKSGAELPLTLDLSILSAPPIETMVNTIVLEKGITSFDTYEPIQGMGLKASFSGVYNPADIRIREKRSVDLKNIHSKTIEILGSGNSIGVLSELDRPMDLSSRGNKKVSLLFDYVYYRVKGRDLIHKTKITSYNSVKTKSKREEIMSQARLPRSTTTIGDTIVLSKNTTINSHTLIPEGKILKINPGTTISIEKGAFICLGTIIAEGTENEPIVVLSQNSAGFSVFNAPERSKLNYVTFNGFNTLAEYGWTLTGAVNFYQSDVDIDNCSFLNNTCEDALNIIDSDFNLNNSIVDNTFSDGFDGDFTVGVVKDCLFKNTGNDCLDFSGSQVSIINTKIQNSGDKGISGGENSQLAINNVEIKNAKIGIASKDLSQLTIDGLNLNDCVYGFTVFKKKSEFGPASVISANVNFNAVDTLHILDLNSSLKLNDQEFIGDVKLDVAALYGL